MHSRWDEGQFRELLDGAMKVTGLSQREMASLAGVSHSQISRWMSGQHRPTYDNTAALGDALEERHTDLRGLTAALLAAAGYRAGLRVLNGGKDDSAKQAVPEAIRRMIRAANGLDPERERRGNGTRSS